jgi:membrane-associated phospholipid phosphatase
MSEPKATPPEPIEKAQEAAQKATAPARHRTYRTVLFQGGLIAVGSALAFLTFLVKTTPFFPVDLSITRGIQEVSNPLFGTLMSLISWPGFPPQAIAIPVLGVAALWLLGLRWEAVAALVAAASSSALDGILKDVIRRPRPAANLVHVFRILNSYSFPSGHVVFYTVFFGFIVFLAFALLKPSIKRTLLIVFFGLLILLVGMSRVYLGQHWASDVAGAYLLGILTLVANIAFYRWGKKRFFITQPVQTRETAQPAKH